MSPSVRMLHILNLHDIPKTGKIRTEKKSKTDYHNIQDIGYLSEEAAAWDTEKKHGKLSNTDG